MVVLAVYDPALAEWEFETVDTFAAGLERLRKLQTEEERGGIHEVKSIWMDGDTQERSTYIHVEYYTNTQFVLSVANRHYRPKG